MVKVVLALAMVLVGSPAWAQARSINFNPWEIVYPVDWENFRTGDVIEFTSYDYFPHARIGLHEGTVFRFSIGGQSKVADRCRIQSAGGGSAFYIHCYYRVRHGDIGQLCIGANPFDPGSFRDPVAGNTPIADHRINAPPSVCKTFSVDGSTPAPVAPRPMISYIPGSTSELHNTVDMEVRVVPVLNARIYTFVVASNATFTEQYDYWNRGEPKVELRCNIGQTYYVRVKVETTDAGESDWSETVSFVAGASGPEPEPEPETLDVQTRGERIATLMNLSPWQAWVHLYCQKDRPASEDDTITPCTVRFECNGMEGEPVTWTVDMEPKTIFSYWPNKTADDGMPADLEAMLVQQGKTETEARRRTTCEVFSNDDVAVRGYTLFGGQPTLIPVAVH